ncbi:MAG: CBS domain-containing protein, partial [Rhodospirillum sp.]|nr:CBS domain-containing protein [Rhodospirillum sp.]
MIDLGEREQIHGDINQAEDVYGLLPEFVEEVRQTLEGEAPEQVAEAIHALVLPLHYADQADLIQDLPSEARAALITALKGEFNAEILPELNDYVRDEVIEILGYHDLASALGELDSDDALYVVAQLAEEERNTVLSRLPPETRVVIEQGLSLPEYSAGRLMQREMVAVPAYWTVGETIDYLRSAARLPDDYYVIYVVDPRHRPVGLVRLSTMLRHQRRVRLREIMEEELPLISTTADQEEVARLFRDRDLLS